MRERPPLTQLRGPVLVLGPAHAGKSELAMQMLAPDRPAVVIGTATLRSESFQRRLERLQGLRPPPWETLETAHDLPATLDEALRRCGERGSGAPGGPQVLVDSVSQWLAGLVVEAADEAREAELEAQVQDRVGELLGVLRRHADARVVLVSSEVGSGPTPPRPVERLYRRLAGEIHQRLAAAAASVVVVHAGIPLVIKS